VAKKSPPNDAREGQPRWTYAVAAIVAAVGLVWGIISYFIPKPEPQKPPMTVTAPLTSGVNVTGSGNVGVGTMSGGTINVPGTAPTPPDKSGASTEERK
jgi:hypothetical protein